MGGYVLKAARETIAQSWRLLGGIAAMLQWKPKLVALLVVLVTLAALIGQFTWADQFTW
jgi:hypothetical protein